MSRNSNSGAGFSVDARALGEMAKALGRSRIAEGMAWPGVLLDLERELVSLIDDQSSPTVSMTIDAHTDDTQDSPMTPMTYKQAARALGVSVSTLRRKVGSGELSAVVVGRSPRFHPDEIRRYLERR